MKKTPSRPRFFKPDRARSSFTPRTLELEIERLSDEGRGIGFESGRAIFVAGALPGERVRVRTITQKRDTADAALVDVLRAAPERIAPRCRLFGHCGGCLLQHMNSETQRLHKQQVLQRLLRGIAPAAVWDAPIVAEPWHYRHRARLTVGEVDGKPVAGFKAAATHKVIAVDACPILDERLQPLLKALPVWLAQLTQWRRIEEIRVAVDAEGCVAIDWEAQRAFPKADAEKLQQLATAAGIACGSGAALRYAIAAGEGSYTFTPADFTQVNPAVNARLVARVMDWLAPTTHDDVADLFCGLGNFTLPLAHRAHSVTGFEAAPAMVKRAAASARDAGCDNAHFQAADLFDNTALPPDTFDKALLDPPRAGAKVLCERLARSYRLRRIVYVSCNPQTLARDLAILSGGGFQVRRAALVDMFAQTGHCEAVVMLERQTAASFR